MSWGAENIVSSQVLRPRSRWRMAGRDVRRARDALINEPTECRHEMSAPSQKSPRLDQAGESGKLLQRIKDCVIDPRNREVCRRGKTWPHRAPDEKQALVACLGG